MRAISAPRIWPNEANGHLAKRAIVIGPNGTNLRLYEMSANVSALLFTMNFATQTCRIEIAVHRSGGRASAAFAHPGGGESAYEE
jgi:hypothetical protein